MGGIKDDETSPDAFDAARAAAAARVAEVRKDGDRTLIDGLTDEDLERDASDEMAIVGGPRR